MNPKQHPRRHLPHRLVILIRATAAALLMTVSSAFPAVAQLPVPTPTPTPDPALQTGPAGSAQLYAPGELIVGVRQPPGAAVSAASASGLAAAVGAEVVQTIDLTAAGGDVIAHVLEVPAGEEYAIAGRLAQESSVAWVEPNWRVWAAQEVAPVAPIAPAAADATLVEPEFAINDAFYATRQWNLQRINAARAWQMAFASDNFEPDDEVIVAVIDSGLDVDHPDFAGRTRPGANYVRDVDTDGDGRLDLVEDPLDISDGCGHGTHVAGIIAAGLNNAVGVAGIAPNVKLDARRALGDACEGWADEVAQAIINAARDGADIINLSVVLKSDSQVIREAVEFAAARGVLLVAAAGNDAADPRWNHQVYYPARYPEVMAVAALGIDDLRTSYSNYGPEIEIAAPGGTLATPVLSTWSRDAHFDYLGDPNDPSDDVRYYRCSNRVFSGTGEYCTRYGTSQASPAVAGAAALLLSVNPDLTASQLRAILRNSASPSAEGAEYVGAGKLDALGALRTQLPPALMVAPSSVFTTVLATDDAFTVTLRLDNPSLAAVEWDAELAASPSAAAGGSVLPAAWITMTSGMDGQQSGTARYGEPAFVTLMISPTVSMGGLYEASVALAAPVAGATVHEQVGILVEVKNVQNSLLNMKSTYLPLVDGGGNFSANVPYTWATPAAASARVSIPLTDTAVSLLTGLPSGIRLGGEPVSELLVYADGFVALRESGYPTDPAAVGASRCIPSPAYPSHAVFGWWADLDPGAAGASVSAFPFGSDRYVIEYSNVPAVGVEQPYRVSFQIVLHRSGDVQLNYASTPHFAGAPEPYTVGVETDSALFYSQVGCADEDWIVGEQPQSRQSLLIREESIF